MFLYLYTLRTFSLSPLNLKIALIFIVSQLIQFDRAMKSKYFSNVQLVRSSDKGQGHKSWKMLKIIVKGFAYSCKNKNKKINHRYTFCILFFKKKYTDNFHTSDFLCCRLSISEFGCLKMLEHEHSQHILSKLILSLGIDEAGLYSVFKS